MKKTTTQSFRLLALAVMAFLVAGAASATEQPRPESLPADLKMFVIERNMPDLGTMKPEELKAASRKSCGVLRDLGPNIQWLHSYVTGDKMYCVYLAPNEQLVREHAKRGGFPADAVKEVTTIISPKTAE
jgi:hypothetical protein